MKAPFTALGLDSVAAVRLMAELSGALGRPLSPTLIFDYPTITALAAYLAGEHLQAPRAVSAGAGPDDSQPIAIVGLACRFPDAPDAAAFWGLLRAGRNAVSVVPKARRWQEILAAGGVSAAERDIVCRGAFLSQIDGFDPLFFGISPREAVDMDPQQRLMLELCWEALEDACIVPSSLKGTPTGVFAGAIWSDYGSLLYRGGARGLGPFTVTGSHHSILANRISYALGLQGPSLALDSACSSGLVVVHLACDSLRRGESGVALAGAVNLNLLPESALAVARFGALSPDGRCATFDARANGYVRGEGGGVVVLKTLARAIADGDRIHAVIRGSAVNNDGATNGLTAPSRNAQEALLREAVRRAGLPPHAIQYVEAHGTGTPLGDPIEARALGAVLGAGRAADAPLIVGSVKTNLGHLEGAAGMAGLIKAVLSIEHRQIPASLHFESPNPHAPLAELGLSVPVTARPWPAPEAPLVAGVSAFGLGGTNGHVVVQQGPESAAEILPLAAASLGELVERAGALRARIAGTGDPASLRELCVEAAARCAAATPPSDGAPTARLAIVPSSAAELQEALTRFLHDPGEFVDAQRALAASRRSTAGAAVYAHAGGADPARGPVFVFPGQGAHWPGMAQSLLATEPLFRSTLQDCDRHIRRFLGWSLLDVLIRPDAAALLDNIEVSLPAIISIDIAVANWWRSLGIEPSAVVGHSTGEIAAAHVAGVLSLADTMQVICAYGRYIGRFTGQGAMALVSLPWEETTRVLAEFAGRVFPAIHDSAEATVIAGTPAALGDCIRALESRGVVCRAVNMNVAPHCPLADSVREELGAALAGISPQPSRIPLISEVTGTELEGRSLDAAHWVRNFGDAVFFSRAIDTLIDRGHRVFLDVGPHPLTKRSVGTNLRRVPAGTGDGPTAVLGSLQRGEDGRRTLLQSLAVLHSLGFPIQWNELYPVESPDVQGASRTHLIPLSARSPAALTALAAAYAERLGPGPDGVGLRDLAYTCSVRREQHPYRLAVTGRTGQAIQEGLRAFSRGERLPWVAGGQVDRQGPPKVVFVFSGQGSQWLGMGRRLLVEEPAFAAALQACDEAIAREAGFSILQELQADEASSRLHEIDVVQPALFAISVALAGLWRSLGVQPDVVLGHSMGEVAAAYVSGILSLEDAVRVICRRSRLLRGASGRGAMALCELPVAEVEKRLAGCADKLSVAVSSGPRSTVISGDPVALQELMARLTAQGVFCRPVKVDVASHSPQMDPLLPALIAQLDGLQPQAAQLTMWSTVSSARVAGPELTATYWAANLRSPVRFAESVQQVASQGPTIFLELSPHPILLPSVEDNLRVVPHECAVIACGRRGGDDRAVWLEAVGQLWTRGRSIDFHALYPSGGRVVRLPLYPWQRDSYWVSESAVAAPLHQARAGAGEHPLLGAHQVLSTQTGTHVWERTIDAALRAWLGDHRVQDAVVYPGAAYLEMALAAASALLDGAACTLRDIAFVDALALRADVDPVLQLVVVREGAERQRFQVASRESQAAAAAWRVHARGLIGAADRAAAPARLDLAGLQRQLGPAEAGEQVYAGLAELGLNYGPAFRGLLSLYADGGEALGHVRLPAAAEGTEGFLFHPALLDSCFHVLACALRTGDKRPWLPVRVRELQLFRRAAGELWCYARLAEPTSGASPHLRVADLYVVDAEGAPVAAIRGLTVQQQREASAERLAAGYFFDLTWAEQAAPAASIRGGRFLILGDGDGVGAALCTALQAAGHSAVQACGAASEQRLPGDPPKSDRGVAAMRLILQGAFAGQAPTAIVHLRSLETPESADAQTLEAALERGCDHVLETVQAVAELGYRDPPKLWLLTRGAQAVGDRPVAVCQSPLVGLARTLVLEHPELRCGLFDLDPLPSPDRLQVEGAALAAELATDAGVQEVALRGNVRRVAQLVHRQSGAPVQDRLEPARGRCYRLEQAQPGVLDGLTLRLADRRRPAAGEVEIEVEAAGLNFADAMMALGIYPRLGDGPVTIGGELAGRITDVGAGVTHLKVGDAVLAFSRAGVASSVTLGADWVASRPVELSAAQGAGQLVAQMTAWYSLWHLARLQPGEKVLIHSATGGTGWAAVQIARALGAQVFATAGSEEKRDWLRAQGIEHVMDSRSTQFARQLLDATAGRGVDVVLNSLAGEAIEASLESLAEDGRFIELGKTDIYADRALGLSVFKKRLGFFAVDLLGLAERRPERFTALLRETVERLRTGELTPLSVTTFPVTQAADALRTMAQGQHRGKLVLTLADPDVRIRVAAARRPAIRRDASYLVTGGLGGLGLRIAGWLAAQGAGQLVLIGRSGASTAQQQQAVAALAGHGTQVKVVQADVADARQVAAVLGQIAHSGLPLAGVFHAAAVLDDGLLAQQTAARIRRVMAPKAVGALLLHQLTRDLPLDFFVLYSSIAGLIGSPGQGNYAAANTLLDALAHARRQQGLAGLSIDWGAFSDVGLAAERDSRGMRLASRGIRSLTPDQGLDALEILLAGEHAQVGVADFDAQQWVQFYPAAAGSPLLSQLVAQRRSAEPGQGGMTELQQRLARVTGAAHQAVLEQFVRHEVAMVLRIPLAKLDPQAPLTTLGMDSLLGLELRNRIEAALRISMPTTLLWTYPTVKALSEHLRKLASEPGERGEGSPAPSQAAPSQAAPSQAAPSQPTSSQAAPSQTAPSQTASLAPSVVPAEDDDSLSDDALMAALRAEL